VAVALAVPLLAAPPDTARVVDRAFAPGGHVTFDLSAGKYTIQGSPDARIHLTWDTRDEHDRSKVWTRVETNGPDARVETDGPKNGFEVTIQVPTRSDVAVYLSAGDLTVSGVEGSKDISAWAGDLKIDVGKASDYKSVDASVTAGEIQAGPFEVRKGGLFRSFTWTGSGRYDLRARLTAGQLVLRAADPAH
jgi:hypothetical protein